MREMRLQVGERSMCGLMPHVWLFVHVCVQGRGSGKRKEGRMVSACKGARGGGEGRGVKKNEAALLLQRRTR